MPDARVDAIRAHALVGRGSCSSVDECMGDDEVLEEVKDMDVDQAVTWALDEEEFWLERGLEQRWGEDDDPQLLAYNRFKEARDADDQGGT